MFAPFPVPTIVAGAPPHVSSGPSARHWGRADDRKQGACEQHYESYPLHVILPFPIDGSSESILVD